PGVWQPPLPPSLDPDVAEYPGPTEPAEPVVRSARSKRERPVSVLLEANDPRRPPEPKRPRPQVKRSRRKSSSSIMPSPSLPDYARSEDEAFAEPFDGGSTGSADDDETEDPVEEEVAEPATLVAPPVPDSGEASAGGDDSLLPRRESASATQLFAEHQAATQAARPDSAQPVREGVVPRTLCKSLQGL
ncbi:hypothetical protein KEM55_006714, partial [Ascosphaera atra]